MDVAAAATRAGPRRPPGAGLAVALTVVALATVACGLLLDAAGVGLGVPLPPFFATWMPRVDGAALVAVPAFAAAVLLAIPLLRGAGGTATFLLASTALALLARVALALTREGVDGLYQVFGADPEAANEYLPALPALDVGVPSFLDRFAEVAPTLPIHPSAHPPGMLLLLDALGISTASGFAALTIAAGVGAVPLTYALARRLALDEGRARAAALLLAFSPAAMIYGVASADALFAAAGVLAAVLLLAPGTNERIAGALALAAASLLTWALLAIGAWATLVWALRDGLGAALRVALLCAAGVASLYLALWAAYGFDPVGAVGAAGAAYDLGIANARPYAFWLLGSPVAAAVALGLPISWYAARALGQGAATAVALAAVVAVAALLGFTKAETERIWLFLGPLACLAAAVAMPRRRAPLVLGLLAAQALAVELALETIW